MPIQSVVFKKKDGWTNREMEKFLADNDLRPIKGVHENRSQYRWRITNPALYSRYISHKVPFLNRRVLLVIGIP